MELMELMEHAAFDRPERERCCASFSEPLQNQLPGQTRVTVRATVRAQHCWAHFLHEQLRLGFPTDTCSHVHR